MQLATPKLCALACSSLALSVTALIAQQPPQFAAPVRLEAGDSFLGVDRLYPSPTLHDMNGDGLADIVIGDLRGRLTVALRQPGTAPASYAAETKVMAVDGKELDFANW